jgi:tetratricopeptide (TPR) repeat protein/tRNA A-37 threonylcarbamoyl transferase component Bud32
MLATPGEIIAERFEIERHVGAGGMGVVYRARDRKTDRPAAIKLVRASDARVTARFAREASVLSELTHPNIVSYIAHGEAREGSLFLAMEWLDGEDLATRLEVKRLTVTETIALARAVATALATAHGRGIVHRDVKPSNIYLVGYRPDAAKLLDFGVVRVLDRSELTHSGAFLGTPLYMAPEHFDDRDVDTRTDVYALGAVMFQCLTGRAPFAARNLPALVTALISPHEAPRVRSLAPHVPAVVDDLIARMLAKDPARRPEDARAVGLALERCALATDPGLATDETRHVELPATNADDLIAHGRAAQAAGRWQQAREAFEAALAVQDRTDVRMALGEVVWWLGDVNASIAHNQQAFAQLRRSEEPGADMHAAMIAIGIGMNYKKTLGNEVAAAGWIARAARLLGDEPGPLHGVLWHAQATCAKDPARAVELSGRALEHARKLGDRDSELISLAGHGGALITAGEIERGLELIDEAMAGTSAGEHERPFTVIAATCCMVTACDQIADADRIVRWTKASDALTSKLGGPLLFAECRAHYGSALVATGRYSEAERELQAARASAPLETEYHAMAVARLAELRLRQGRLADAEQMLAPIADRPLARPISAALHLAQGRPRIAAALLQRFIDSVGSNVLEAIGALDLLVDVWIADGNRDEAAAAARRLTELTRTNRAPAVAAHAAFAAGRVATDVAIAQAELERAIELFREIQAPHEAARARLALARLLVSSSRELAADEVRVAATAFEQLGAARDAAAAGELLRALG